MRLIYVNEIGSDYKGQKQYEFIFSVAEDIVMDTWFDIPASSAIEPTTPDVEYITQVGLLKDLDVRFELIQNSDYFGVVDAADGIVALAWETSNYIEDDNESDQERLFFRFGDKLETVNKKLKSRGYELETKTLNTVIS